MALLPVFGLTEVGLSQTPPELPVGPDAALRSAIPSPALTTPDLPPLGEFSRYQPEDQTIYLVLKLGERRVHVYQGEKLLASYPVAVGRPEFPTPTGEFEIFEMIVNPAWQNPWTGEVEAPGADGSLGLRWIGFTKMPNGVIGFHGTPNVASIGRAASHGCVRMRNEDIVKLYEHVKVGTLVRVES
jgi:lipoprotein-anchoring transpeptidase ErfK/SrfK